MSYSLVYNLLYLFLLFQLSLNKKIKYLKNIINLLLESFISFNGGSGSFGSDVGGL